MRKKLWMIVCLAGAAAVGAGAQPSGDEKTAEKAFRDSLAGQLLIARGFSAEREVEYQWTGHGLEPMAPPLLRTLGSIEVESVKVKSQRIEIKGMRQTLLRRTRQGGDQEVSEGSPVVLIVALGGADAASVLPRLKEAMFYADLDEALADVPPIDRGMIGFRVERPAGAESSPGTGAETRPGRRGAAQRVCPADPSSFRQPKVMHSVDPEFSEEARRAKISGNVTVGFTVDTDGSTTDLWIIRPMGYGLDEQAAKAVRRYEFEPATCAGEPVASSLLIEVNFQIFR